MKDSFSLLDCRAEAKNDTLDKKVIIYNNVILNLTLLEYKMLT